MFGPYRPPHRSRPGDRLFCQLRGWVEVGGLSDSPVPWPYMKARGRHSHILTGDLVRAVRQEASIVVCHLFGVTAQTVTKWRATLGVPHATPGTSERKAAPKRGMARPKHVVEVLRRKGRRLPEAQKAKIGAPLRRLGIRPPKGEHLWKAWEDELVRRLPAPAVAAETGRSLAAVYSRRNLLKVPDGRPGK
jgi:hypothetical protein